MSEKEIANKIGAKLIKNSGRGTIKGDMKWKSYIVDAKEQKSFTLNSNAWAKVCSDALSNGIEWEPMILVVLDGSMVACIEYSHLEYLEHRISELEEEVWGIEN